MIYKCIKPEARDCNICLFESICYDCDDINNAVQKVSVLETESTYSEDEV